jgi:hypothetical protein
MKKIVHKATIITVILIVAFLATPGLFAADRFFEDFTNLDNWEELLFDKIETHTKYTIEEDGENSLLKIDSNKSASGKIFTQEFSVYDYPIVEWKWLVENIVEKGNAKKKEGDDYPIRIYIIFPYDPKGMGFFEKIGFETAKAIYGEYPPMASLNYIWANREHSDWVIPNPFTNRAMMIPVEEGSAHVGEWRTYTVNLIDDYRKAFGKEPPKRASLAIMGDTDNTLSSAVAYLDYIRVTSE